MTIQHSLSVLKNDISLFSDDDFIDENPGLAIYAIRLILKKLQGDLEIKNNRYEGATIKMIFNLITESEVLSYPGKSNTLVTIT